MFLTFEEVFELTHKKTRTAQVRALRYMGIEHKVRPDGSVAVARTHVEKILGANITENATIKGDAEPNWEVFNA
ncbi:MAG: DUF4224 domain-containing protein [Bacteroidetes bacterium]|nr:DUF4224 domain-containing protein [Bacteroidota bacterium]